MSTILKKLWLIFEPSHLETRHRKLKVILCHTKHSFLHPWVSWGSNRGMLIRGKHKKEVQSSLTHTHMIIIRCGCGSVNLLIRTVLIEEHPYPGDGSIDAVELLLPLLQFRIDYQLVVVPLSMRSVFTRHDYNAPKRLQLSILQPKQNSSNCHS